MRLSENTRTILANFTQINNNIIIKPGNKLKCISPDRLLYGVAEVEEEFTEEFGIYNLQQFVNVLGTFSDDCEITIKDDVMVIADDFQTVRYYAASANTLTHLPKDESPLYVEADYSAHLPLDRLDRILKLARLNALPNISLIAENGKVSLRAHDATLERTSSTTNSANVLVDANYDGPSFKATFRKEWLIMIPGDYHVDIIGDTMTRFRHAANPLTYFIVQVAD